MTPELAIFEPELEDLLREIAADPRSQLLRLPRPESLPALLARPGPVSAGRAGLSAAERHLLEVHRDELADVLRRACLTRFFSDPQRSIYLNRSRNARELIRFDTPEQWRARAHQALEDARRGAAQLAGLDLLEACLRSEPTERISITQLARTSLLLQPTDVAEAYVGLDLILSSKELSGIKVLEQLISDQPSTYVKACSLENVALGFGISGQDAKAITYYRRSAQVDNQRPAPIMGWLVCALIAADRQEARVAAAWLDAIAGGDHPAVDHFISCKTQQRSRGLFKVSGSARRLMHDLASGEGSASGRIADALA